MKNKDLEEMRLIAEEVYKWPEWKRSLSNIDNYDIAEEEENK